MQIGIVGLPFSGKSTLFQAITKTHLDPAVLTKAEAHHAIVKVPDPRLEKLSGMFNPKKTVFATIEFVDVVGLKRGESGSTQFTTNFFSNVKTNDALVQVVRVFTNHAVPHPDGTVDALRDVVSIETEFILSDLAIIEGRLERIEKQLSKSGDEHVKREQVVLQKCRQLLEAEKPLREAQLSAEEEQVLKTYQLLTMKPMLIALNFDEGQQGLVADLKEKVGAAKAGAHTRVTSFFGKVEMEISELSDEESRAFMAEFGITESALNTLIREAYTLLGLQSFFTVGEDECRAWTIRRGMSAQESAGVIHSDFFLKFIRAEVVGYPQFIDAGGSFPKTKEAGQWRLEGKEYVVNDGDIINVRHS